MHYTKLYFLKQILILDNYLNCNYQISVKTSPNNSKMLEKKRRNEEILKNFQAKNNLMSQDKMLNELTQKHTSNFIFKPEKDFSKNICLILY